MQYVLCQRNYLNHTFLKEAISPSRRQKLVRWGQQLDITIVCGLPEDHNT